ncbi:MAG: restriction endonuclease subunit S [Verrucomicrobiota bacterium]
MSFPRYPKYKDSGVEWLGQVPEHWTVISIKWTSPVKRGASPRPIDDPKYFDDEGEFAWVRIADVSACDGVLKETTQRLSELGSSLSVKISPGELFISIAGTVGKPCLSAIKACIHDGFVYFPTLKIAPQFLYRIFEGGTCYGGLGKWGTQLNLNTDTIGSIRIALPPSDELMQILAFLDRETAKIDELVAEQKRLMELLTEKVKALVLSSFDMPDTKHQRFGSVAEVISRPVTQQDGEEYTRIGLYNRGRGLFHKDASEKDDMGDSDFFWVESGDLIISGQFAWEGAVALASEDDNGCVVSHRYPVLRGKPGVSITEYLFALLLTRHGDFLLNEHARGAAGRNRPLNISALLKERIPLPNLQIQQAVAKTVHHKKQLLVEISHQIDLLQERRTALISAAVTGQIDVRNH